MKTKNIIRTVSLILCLVMTLTLFSCVPDSKKALKIGKTYFSEQTYAYYLTCYKQYWLTVYGQTDSDEFWTADSEGIKISEYLQNVSVKAIESKLIGAYLFDSYGLNLTQDEYDAIDTLIEGMLGSLEAGALENDKVFSQLGIDKDDLREIFIVDSKTAALQDYLFGETGTNIVTNEERETFYQGHYFRFKHFYLMNYDYDRDADGNIQYDENGYAKVKEITDERYEEKVALANEVLQKAKNGEDFDSLINTYSEELSKDKYPLGHYLTVPNDYNSDLSNAVTAADIGELVLFETSLGVHIIQRIELDSGAWGKAENEYGGDFNGFEELVIEAKFKDILAGHYDDIVVNTELTDKYKLSEMPYSEVWYYLF